MRNREDFLVAASAEAISTIRSLDVKLAAFLVAVLVPLQVVVPIVETANSVYTRWPSPATFIALLVFYGSWLLSAFCLALALGAVTNPASHISGAAGFSGAFFTPGMFTFGAGDAFANFAYIQSKRTPEEHLAALPNTQDAISGELAFEHLKLVYIRDLKLHRMSYGFRLAGTAVAVGLTLLVIGKYLL